MGCGCKQKPSAPPIPQTKMNDGTIQVGAITKPPYSIEEVNRALNYINSQKNDVKERRWTYDFHNKHFSEKLALTCVSCEDRMLGRFLIMKQTIEQYEFSRQTQDNPQ